MSKYGSLAEFTITGPDREMLELALERLRLAARPVGVVLTGSPEVYRIRNGEGRWRLRVGVLILPEKE